MSKTDKSQELKPQDFKSQDFESALSELEKIVTTLEGELPLAESLSLFERGIALSQDLEKFLKSAEQKIDILKKSADGTISTQPYKEQTN